MARHGRAVGFPVFWFSLFFLLSLLPAGAFPARYTDNNYGMLSSALDYGDSLDSESISVEEMLAWQDTESGAILASSELYGNPSTESTIITTGGYELINGSKYSKLSIANCSGNKIDVRSSKVVLNRSDSQISHIAAIKNSNSSYSIIAGGPIDIDGAPDHSFLLALEIDEDCSMMPNSTENWLIESPNRILRSLSVTGSDQGGLSVITAETEDNSLNPAYLRVYDLQNKTALSLQTEITLDVDVPIALAETPFTQSSMIDFIIAAKRHGFSEEVSLYRMDNSSGTFALDSLGNFSQAASYIFPRQLLASQASPESSTRLLLFGETLRDSQSGAFFLEIDIDEDSDVAWGDFVTYERDDVIFTSCAAILHDIDGNGVEEIIWQLEQAPLSGQDILGKLWIIDRENSPELASNQTLCAMKAQNIFPRSLIFADESPLLLSVGFHSNGTSNYGYIATITLQPIVLNIGVEKSLWTFEETVRADVSCAWWHGGPIIAAKVKTTFTGSDQLVHFTASGQTNDTGNVWFNIDLANVSEAGFYNLSGSVRANGWEGASNCSLWLDWQNELETAWSSMESYGGKIKGKITLTNVLSRNEVLDISLHDPSHYLRNFEDYRTPTHHENIPNMALERQFALLGEKSLSRTSWNGTSIALESDEEVELFFNADADVQKQIALELVIISELVSQSFSFTVISEEIWLSPTFQFNLLAWLLFFSLIVAITVVIGRERRNAMHFFNSLPHDQPIDLAETATQYGPNPEWTRKQILKRIPGYISVQVPNQLLPERFLLNKARELITVEAIKSLKELSTQLAVDEEASRALLATLHRVVIEKDEQVLRDRIRGLLSDLTEFSKLAKADAKLKGLTMGALATPETPEAQKAKITTCAYCNATLETTETCPQCGNPLLRCAICRLSIAFGENTAICPECGSVFHQDHLSEWLKIKATCPICNHAF
ncbi:MAG: RING finger domain-containing protein [Candidatus Thorarchaeota archaeon]